MTVLAFTQLRTPADGAAASTADTRVTAEIRCRPPCSCRHLSCCISRRLARRTRPSPPHQPPNRCASRQLVQVRRKPMAPEDYAVSRRSLLRGAALLGLGGLVSGCGSALASGIAGTGPPGNTLAYWNLFGGGDGVRMLTMEQGYQKTAPRYRPERGDAGVGQPLLHEALAGHAREPATGRRDLAPDPDVDPGGCRPAGAAEPDDLARYGLTGGQVHPAAWDTGARRTASCTRSRSTPTRS